MKPHDSPKTRSIALESLPIDLSAFLKFTGLADSGGAAKYMIREGQVVVNGEVEIRKARKLHAGDRVEAGGQTMVITAA